MDEDRSWRQLALRARADEAITAALAAADARAPLQCLVVSDALEAVNLACWDPALDPGDALALIDNALRLTASLKELTGADDAARPALIADVYRRTSDMLRRYARFVRAGRAGS
jgi:hypothetical protein